jgi:4-hydroxythreonine-4-phosphate dehydrogenase
LLSEERITEVIQLTRETHKNLLGSEPRIAVCGLNPHAGENGLFGNGEEEKLILPAIEKMKEKGYCLTGPLPPDTAFTESRRKEIDAYVCMYHDQALIPVKALAFEEAVNVTLGLPIVRTSVDHGTALDIAWQGKADASSLKAAVNLAVRMSD